MAKSISVKTGTLVGATIIASASETDGDGRWVKHKSRPAVHGFKAHVGADASTALVEKVWVTPANYMTAAARKLRAVLSSPPARSSQAVSNG